MQIDEDTKAALSLLNNPKVVDNDTFKKLLENCCSVLITKVEPHSFAGLLTSKPDVVKQVYAALLKISLEFARHNASGETVLKVLKTECNLEQSKCEMYSEHYQQNKIRLQIVLGNIGSHLPHIVDVKWKIDYIVKTNNYEEFQGPIFHVVLIADEYDEEKHDRKQKEIRFSCDSRQLQDLVYKLKDAVRHCQKLSVEH